MVTSAPRTAGEAPAEFLPDALRRAAELLLAESAAGTGGLLAVDGCRAGALAALADGVSRPSASASPRQLLERAGEARAAGQPDRALRLLDETLACTNDPLVRADAQHLRGLISLWRAAPAQASRELLAEAARIEELDPGKAAWM